jgi:hypothetical protein
VELKVPVIEAMLEEGRSTLDQTHSRRHGNVRKFGRESFSRILWARGIRKCERLDTDEAERNSADILLRWSRITYYSFPLGPMEGSGVNWTVEVVATSTLATIICNNVY